MLEKFFGKHTKVFKYSHSAYLQPSFPFYGAYSLINSCEGAQQEDPESPVLFSDSIQNLIDSLESKINLWYLDDGILSDDYRTVLKDLKKLVEAEENWDSKLKRTNENFFLGDITEKRCATLLAFSKNFAL